MSLIRNVEFALCNICGNIEAKSMQMHTDNRGGPLGGTGKFIAPEGWVSAPARDLDICDVVDARHDQARALISQAQNAVKP